MRKYRLVSALLVMVLLVCAVPVCAEGDGSVYGQIDESRSVDRCAVAGEPATASTFCSTRGGVGVILVLYCVRADGESETLTAFASDSACEVSVNLRIPRGMRLVGMYSTHFVTIENSRWVSSTPYRSIESTPRPLYGGLSASN